MLAAQGQTPVSAEHGAAVAKDLGARYAECSAKTGVGVQDVFTLALRESMKRRWRGGSGGGKPTRCVVI
jgi:Rho family protein